MSSDIWFRLMFMPDMMQKAGLFMARRKTLLRKRSKSPCNQGGFRTLRNLFGHLSFRPAQTKPFAGSWYQVPYGSIELYKSSGNTGISDGNPNYSLAGAQYGVFHGESQVATLTTNEQGYAKVDNLEVLDEGDSYTIRELSASPGFAIDVESHKVSVTPEGTATVKVKEIPQNQPLDLLLQKLDADLNEAKPQGSGSLSSAEFTIKFYTEQMDTDPAQSEKEPERTWIFKTDSSGAIRFSKEFFVSGDDFYYASDGKTICLPLGTVTIQETKAPAGYQLNNTVFVQKIVGTGNEETISVFNAPKIEDAVFRGGVKVQKRDLETNGTAPQGGASLANAVFTITTLNEQPVVVNGKTYEKDSPYSPYLPMKPDSLLRQIMYCLSDITV